MLRHPAVTSAVLGEVVDDPPRHFRSVVLEQTEARVLHDFPLDEQRRYWEQLAAVDPSERRALQLQAWRYALLKARLTGSRESGSG